MMKKIVMIVMFSTLAFSSMNFEKNKKCSECHAEIYKEYQASQHANSTVFKDEIHAAVYNKHPQKNKLQKYRCAKCHTPTADNMKELLAVNNGVIPDIKNETQNESVACAYCHRIVDVKSGKAMSQNVISKEPKKYFANLKKKHRSEFHTLETHIDVFENGKICMGCHMHKTNKQKFEVCSTENNNLDGNNNCITCHMPKVKGSISNVYKTDTHSFHGFPGIHGDMKKYLSKYVTLDIKQTDKGFNVSIDHKAAHSSTLHPVRMSKLVVRIKRGKEFIELKPINFMKLIGTKGRVSPPWLATEIVKDSRIGANTKKDFDFNFELKSDDIISAKFGHLLVKTKALKKFGLENSDEAKKFRVIAEKSFKVK